MNPVFWLAALLTIHFVFLELNHECRLLIDYATHYLPIFLVDSRSQAVSVC